LLRIRCDRAAALLEPQEVATQERHPNRSVAVKEMEEREMGCGYGSEDRLRYVAGLMDEGEAARFERHILSCSVCRKEVEALSAEEHLIKGVLGGVGRRGDVVSSVMRRIVVQRVGWWRWIAAGVAAAALLIAAAVPFSRAQHPTVATHTITHTLTTPPVSHRPIPDIVINRQLLEQAEEEGVD